MKDEEGCGEKWNIKVLWKVKCTSQGKEEHYFVTEMKDRNQEID